MDARPGAEQLRRFRERLYGCSRRRADALFELCDAMLASGTVNAPVHLSLAAVHRRGWGSLYAALRHGAIDVEALRGPLAWHTFPLSESTPVYAVDVSAWPRNDAEFSSARGYHYHPSRHSAGQPIVAGWAYRLVAGLGFERDSWAAPVDVRRVSPEENANEVAAGQVRDLTRRLAKRDGVRGEAPLFVFDAGYDPVRLQRDLEGHRAQILVRLHLGRVFYADPEPRLPRPVVRPPRHGERFDLKDPRTWHEPSSEWCTEDTGYGMVRVSAWAGLHPKTRKAAERYGAETASVARGTVVLVEVGRLPRGERRRKPKQLWMWWNDPGEPDLALLWKAYVRRFDVEHAVKFFKGTLGWTAPRVRYPVQADLWTWLVLAAYIQLRLAQSIVADRRLPWERLFPAARGRKADAPG